MSQVLIIDTETTGFTEPVEPIEVAWAQLDAGPINPDLDLALDLMGRFDQRYKPSQPISFGAMATHHITDADLADCPPSTDFALPENTTFWSATISTSTGMSLADLTSRAFARWHCPAGSGRTRWAIRSVP